MTAPSVQRSEAPPVAVSTARPHAIRAGVALGAGVVLSVALGLVLSYVAFLMALLGLFFYTLFGLVIGAVAYRLATPARPYPRAWVWVGTGALVVSCWGTSLAWEMRDFPNTIARTAIEKVPRLPPGLSKEDFRARVRADARAYLARRYGSEGPLGYVRWILASGRVEPGAIEGVAFDIPVSQHGWTWILRVVLSLVLTCFGVGSQTWALARDPGIPPPGMPDTQA